MIKSIGAAGFLLDIMNGYEKYRINYCVMLSYYSQFCIPMTESLEREVEWMCNLSQGVYDKGYGKGTFDTYITF